MSFKILYNDLSFDKSDLKNIRLSVFKVFNINDCDEVAIISSSPFEDALSILLFFGFVKNLILLPSEINHKSIFNEPKANKNNTLILNSGDLLDSWRNESKNKKTDNLEFKSSNHLTIFTSGTTGDPKMVTHQVCRLISSFNSNLLNRIWGLTYEPYRMAGLQSVLSAYFLENVLVISNSFKISNQISCFLKNSVDSISATPSRIRQFASYEKFNDLKLNQISLGGEISDQPTLDLLKKKFPKSRIIHIYASTELGVGFSVTDGLEGFPSKYLKNTNIKYPEIVINNSMLCFKVGNEILETGDLVSLEGERYKFLGRDTGLINIGGNKILPEQIESKLRELEFISELRAYGEPHKLLGSVIAVDIQLKSRWINEDREILKKRIRSFCKENLPRYSIPVIINFSEINILASGKVKR